MKRIRGGSQRRMKNQDRGMLRESREGCLITKGGGAKEGKASEPGSEVAIRSSNYYISGFLGQARQWNSGSKKPNCCRLRNKGAYS